MTIKLIGAFFVILGCGGFGFLVAHNVRKETMCLRQFIIALDYMECELNYRLTPLPQLCTMTATVVTGPIQQYFVFLAEELKNQTAFSAQMCALAAMDRCTSIPASICRNIEVLAHSLGTFDIAGQLKSIRVINEECKRALELISQDQGPKLRSYKTLALCAGAALVILFI